MKKSIIILSVGMLGLIIYMASAQTNPPVTSFQAYEYATIRWSGREHTHLIRPNGAVESLGPLLETLKRPDRTDDRAFYLNIAMNAVAREGFEFAGMTQDAIVMKRPVGR